MPFGDGASRCPSPKGHCVGRIAVMPIPQNWGCARGQTACSNLTLDRGELRSARRLKCQTVPVPISVKYVACNCAK